MPFSADEQHVLDVFGDDFGAEVGESIVVSMRPYSVACPERHCKAPLGTCCLTPEGAVLDEPHDKRVRRATRRHGSA